MDCDHLLFTGCRAVRDGDTGHAARYESCDIPHMVISAKLTGPHWDKMKCLQMQVNGFKLKVPSFRDFGTTYLLHANNGKKKTDRLGL